MIFSGCVYAWGSGYKDSRRGGVPPVLGLGLNEARVAPEKITSISDYFIISLSSGWDHCLALDNKGNVLSWGSGQNGKLGHGNDVNVSMPTLILKLASICHERGSKIVEISAGCEHSACIDSKGILYTWGHGEGGRLGHGDNSSVSIPTPVDAFTKMGAIPISVHCGDKFTLVIAKKSASEYTSTHKVVSRTWLRHLVLQADDSMSCDVFQGLVSQWKSIEQPDLSQKDFASCVPMRCYDVGHLLISRLGAALADSAFNEALFSTGESNEGDTNPGAEETSIVYEKDQAYAIEVEVATFHYFSLLLNMLCEQCSLHSNYIKSDKLDVQSDEVRELSSLLQLLVVIQRNLAELAVKSRRLGQQAEIKRNLNNNFSGNVDFSLTNRLAAEDDYNPHLKVNFDKENAVLDEDYVGEGEGADVESGSFLELCDAAEHVALPSCSDSDSDSDSSDSSADEKEDESGGIMRPRFMVAESTHPDGTISADGDSLAHTQHQYNHGRQLNSSLDGDTVHAALCSLALSEQRSQGTRKEFDDVLV